MPQAAPRWRMYEARKWLRASGVLGSLSNSLREIGDRIVNRSLAAYENVCVVAVGVHVVGETNHHAITCILDHPTDQPVPGHGIEVIDSRVGA